MRVTLFGKPISLQRSGAYAGGSVSATRSYVYDPAQRLCKVIEPESGATIVDYNAANNVLWSAAGQALTSTSDCQRGSVAASAKASHSYDALNRLLTTATWMAARGLRARGRRTACRPR